MRSGPVPETLLDALMLATGLAPRPLVDTLLATGLAQTIMVASRLGIFDALAGGTATSRDVARRCGTHPEATDKLLAALVGAGYLEARGEQFALTATTRRWLVSDSRFSLRDHMELMFVVWRWLEHYEHYVKSGEPLDVHRAMSQDEWSLYQKGMRALAGLLAPEVALRTPVPRGARALLDLGGSHGYYSVALCRRHPQLSATVLDLPEAIDHARSLLAREAMGSRVSLSAGDARTHELGEDRYDVVFVANLVHHFDPDENQALMGRIARALRPGGALVVQEVMRGRGATGRQPAALGELYFAALSAAGLYDYAQIAGWQRRAGLTPMKPIRFVSYPGVGQQPARKR